jgi:hypothetical protein
LLEIAIISPRGKVKMTPVPIVAGEAHRRRSFVGLVGDVPHASADVTVPAGDAGSSASTVSGDVGVTPAAAGRPSEYVEAVAAAMKMPASRITARSVDVVTMVCAALPDVTFEVRRPIE